MLKIASTPVQALANIRKFEKELRHSPELQGHLAYARAWYAHQDDSGAWCFAPSKFVGYAGIHAKAYLEGAEETDGRRTEAQLQMWFNVVDPTTALHDELSSALVAFLAKFGKTPSTKMRINVLRQRRRIKSDALTADESQDAVVVNLIVAVAKTLPNTHFQNLRSQLEDLWA
jgi:hypothetical protein